MTYGLEHCAIAPRIAVRVTIGEIEIMPGGKGLHGTTFCIAHYMLASQFARPYREIWVLA
jgi:hypothetical protein